MRDVTFAFHLDHAFYLLFFLITTFQDNSDKLDVETKKWVTIPICRIFLQEVDDMTTTKKNAVLTVRIDNKGRIAAKALSSRTGLMKKCS